MDPINKTALRAAVLIHEQMASGKRQDASLYLPEYTWTNIQRLRRQIDRARRHGWHRAASRLNEDLATALDNSRRELENAFRALKSRSTERPVSSASDIYRDVLALHDEFEEVEIELDKHEISVTTDRIVLEDLNFGPFQVRLDWHCLGSMHAYRVVALDPHPAAKSDDVTHPHVQDEQLCEGEGRAAIRAALAECRLHDFFMLVSRLLHTYGRGAAFVELNDWSGVNCSDCGATMSPDDSYCCQRCGSELCNDCRQSCAGCEESHCSGCLSQCPECEMDFCRGCLEACPGCGRKICGGCMEDGLCPSCREEQSQEEKEEHDASEGARNEPVAPRA
jgi:hypothetical protein